MNRCIEVTKVAGVIECHDDHNSAAQQVRRVIPLGGDASMKPSVAYFNEQTVNVQSDV